MPELLSSQDKTKSQGTFASFRFDGTNVALERQSTLSPVKNRKCRDVLFLIIFFLFSCGTAYLAVQGNKEGDMDRIRYGISSLNQLCGQGALGSAPSAVGRPSLLYCSKRSIAFGGSSEFRAVCVKDCPNSLSDLNSLWDDTSTQFARDLNQTFVETYPEDYSDDEFTKLDMLARCMPYTKVLFNRCFLDYTMIANSTEAQDFADEWNFQQYMNDLQMTWQVVIACGVGVSLIVSWLMLMVMKFLAGMLVWVSVILFNLLMVAATLYTAHQGGLISDEDVYGTGQETEMEKENEQYMSYLAYALAIVTGITFLLTIFFRTRINLAIGILREAADVMKAMPLIIFIPIPAWMTTALLTLVYVYISCVLYTMGEIKNGALEVDNMMRNMLIYVLLWYFWTVFFFDAIGNLVTAGAVSGWYWTRDKNKVFFPITVALKRALRYHLGSLAFGSFLHAVIRTIRIVFTFYTRNVKKLSKKYRIVKILLWVSQYCLWYVEKVIKFLNRNAYIMIAVFGEGYCPSAKNAFLTLAGNAARFIAVSVVSHFIIFLSIMIVIAASTIACYCFLESDQFDPDGTKAVSSPLLPVLLTAVSAFMVARTFFATYDMVIDTLFMCFSKDEEQNSKTGNFYARPRLQKYMHTSFKKGKAPKKPN